MPKHLIVASLLYIACRSAMAVLAPLYETGVSRITSPVLMLLFIVVAVLFMRRVSWTWRFMQWIASTEIALNALFFPTAKFHGAYTDLARVLVAAIMVACCVILWSLIRRPETKSWFAHRDA
jgi:hypothetical protein